MQACDGELHARDKVRKKQELGKSHEGVNCRQARHTLHLHWVDPVHSTKHRFDLHTSHDFSSCAVSMPRPLFALLFRVSRHRDHELSLPVTMCPSLQRHPSMCSSQDPMLFWALRWNHGLTMAYLNERPNISMDDIFLHAPSANQIFHKSSAPR